MSGRRITRRFYYEIVVFCEEVSIKTRRYRKHQGCEQDPMEWKLPGCHILLRLVHTHIIQYSCPSSFYTRLF